MTTIPSNVRTKVQHHRPMPFADLRWPASAIWRPGEPDIRTIGLADLKDAVARGIDDFRAMPSHALYLVILYPLIGLALSWMLLGANLLPLVYPMIMGFALIGPVAAIGLYELSRRREAGLETSAWHALDVLRSPSIGAILRMGLVLLALFYTWMITARAIYTQYFGDAVPAGFSAFVNEVLTTPAGWKLMLVGNAVGLLFALLAFVISVVSIPMLVDRDVGAAVAIRASIRSVVENLLTMALWGLFVTILLLAASLPLFVGLAVALPVLGHATWHLYRRLVAE
ncbi:MAG: DUF2189 domain-containing protein [Hyphomicrobium sp.]